MTYKFVYLIAKLYYAIFFKLEVHGFNNVPKEGAAILCANHLSNYDPITLTLALNKLPSFLAKSQLFTNKLLGGFLLRLNAIPVNREKVEMKSFRTVMNRLKDGRLVCIFAQGHRVKEGESAEAKAGVALFAVKSGAPVIPTAIITKYKFFKKVVVVFGEPIDFSEYSGRKVMSKELEYISKSLMDSIKSIHSMYS